MSKGCGSSRRGSGRGRGCSGENRKQSGRSHCRGIRVDCREEKRREWSELPWLTFLSAASEYRGEEHAAAGGERKLEAGCEVERRRGAKEERPGKKKAWRSDTEGARCVVSHHLSPQGRLGCGLQSQGEK